MTLSDTERKPRSHVEITKGGTTIAIDLANGNYEFDPTAIKKEMQPRLPIKMYQGGTKHSDYEPPYASTEQRDFSGGRGLNDNDLDETRFMDSFRANTWKEGRLTLAPRASYGKGQRDADTNMWHGWSSENTTIVFRPMYSSTVYWSMKFTAGASYDASVIGFILRKVGTGGGSIRFGIYSNDGGEPDTELEGVNSTTVLSADDIMSEIVYLTFSSAESLTSGTIYHAVAFTSGGTAANHWEIACKYVAGSSSGFYSADAATWTTSAGYEPYFRITDAVKPFTAHFFEYRGALMAWLSYNDGSDPRLFVNGQLGRATSTTAAQVTDSAKSMTTNAYQYGTLAIFAGQGSETSDRFRVIVSNTATQFNITPNWASVPDESSFYAVIGQDTWTEITGHGLTGPKVTDVLSINNLVYTCQGDERDIWRGYYLGMTGQTFTREQGNRGFYIAVAPDSNGRRKIWLGRKTWLSTVEKADPVWGSGSESNLDFGFTDLVTNGDMEIDANWASVGTPTTNERSSTRKADGTYSRHLVCDANDEGITQTLTPTSGDFYKVSAQVYLESGALTMEVGGTVIGSTSTADTWILLSGNRKAASASETIQFLSDGGAAEFYVDSVQVKEHPTYIDNVGFERLTNMLAYGEPERLWVTTDGSVYMEDNGDMVSIPLKEFHNAKDERNGWAAIVHDVYLYLGFLDSGLERYYKGNLDDVGPNRDEGLPKLRRGYIYDMIGYPGRIYAAMHAGRITGYSSILLYNGVGWHEVYRHPTVGEPITKMYIQTMPNSNQGTIGPIVDRLWFAVGSDLMRIDVDLNPDTNVSYRYHWEGWVESSWIYYQKQDITKYWKELKIFLERMADDSGDTTSIYAQYKTDEDTSWTDIGSFDTEPSETIDLAVNGKRIKFRYLLRTENMKYTPIMKSAVVDFIEQVPVKDTFTMTFIAQDNNISLQGSPDFDRVETDLNILEGWLDDPSPATINSQISMINGKTVKVLGLDYRPINVDPQSQKEKLFCTLQVMEV